ncbi:hypothetical protein ABTD95_19580, partial [Acinetobacter baumannii]
SHQKNAIGCTFLWCLSQSFVLAYSGDRCVPQKSGRRETDGNQNNNEHEQNRDRGSEKHDD